MPRSAAWRRRERGPRLRGPRLVFGAVATLCALPSEVRVCLVYVAMVRLDDEFGERIQRIWRRAFVTERIEPLTLRSAS